MRRHRHGFGGRPPVCFWRHIAVALLAAPVADRPFCRRLQVLEQLRPRDRLNVPAQRCETLGVAPVSQRRNFGHQPGPQEFFDFAARQRFRIGACVRDQIDAGYRNAEALHVAQHRLRTGDAEQRRLQHQKEPVGADDERAHRGGKWLRRVDDNGGEALHRRGQALHRVAVKGIGRIVAFCQLDDGDAVHARGGDRRGRTRGVEGTHAVQQDRNAAPAGQIAVDQGDVPIPAHRPGQLSAQRRRSDATLDADKDRNR